MKMKNIVMFSVIAMFIMVMGNIASAMDVPVYKQGTPSVWAGDQLGTCASTIGAEGCAVTSVAMVFKYYGVQTDPRDLNNWLKGNNGYTNGCWIRWDIAAGRSGGTVQFINQYSYPNPLTTAELNLINSELDSGYPVIAEVRLSGSQHFVVITGRSGSTYNINDPANGDKSTLNARYGNPSTAIWGIRLYHGSAAPAISILDASISPNVASPGDTLTFVYSINNPGTSNVNNVRLGARIRTYSPQGVWIDNWDNDKIEIIYPGTRNYERNFQVPSTASIGLYDAQWVLVNNADETWYTSWLSSPILTIQAQTGTISVTTNNPSATFTVTGPATYTGSGSSWSKTGAPVGTYSITFGSVSGFTTPTDTPKTLSSGGTASFSGTYQAQTGTISVTTNNPGATFTVTGPATYTGSGSSWSKTGAPVGTYSITFGSVSGFTTPTDTPKTLSSGGTASFSGTYQAQTGTISVTTNNPGATFTVTGPATYTGSGSSWSKTGAPVGTYSITFGSVSGFTTPTDTPKTLSSGGTASFSGTYQAQTGTISVTTNNPSATFTVTGPATYTGSGSSWTRANAPVGTYSITFASISGKNTPSDTSKTLTNGGSITFSGTYTDVGTIVGDLNGDGKVDMDEIFIAIDKFAAGTVDMDYIFAAIDAFAATA